MHVTSRSVWLLGAAILAFGACAGTRAASPFSADQGSVELEVWNDNFSDATLHVLRGGERIRIGIVTGHTGETFLIDWRFSMPFRVEIDLLAGGRCVTRALQVDPGDTVYLQIESRLSSMSECSAT
jgi:hypothetical protein